MGVLADENYEKFWTTYNFIVITVLTLCLAIECISLGIATGLPIPVDRAIPGVLGVFFLALGNVFPRLRSNWWVGIRTPWSLSSDANWSRTQRVAGYLLVLAGVLLLADAAVPGLWMSRIAYGSVVAAAAGAVIVSYTDSAASTVR